MLMGNCHNMVLEEKAGQNRYFLSLVLNIYSPKIAYKGTPQIIGRGLWWRNEGFYLETLAHTVYTTH